MKRNLLYILGVVCLMTSCVEERVKEFEAAPGVEVDFNISMAGGPETKTLYGAESADGKSIKVNWVTGDLVEIFGTNCSVNQAEYKVTAQDTPTNVAKSLDKTAEVGVRWGDSGTSDFYALYPSDGASFTENIDGTVTLKTTISETQNNVFTLNETRTVELKETVNNVTTTYNIPVWEGTHFADDAANPSMPSAIMYACTKGAAAKDDQGNLQPVSLHFKPFATVLKFRFMGYTSSLTDPTVYVQSIVVEAPKDYNIAGDFNLGISGTGTTATATATSANTTPKNVVTLNTILPGGTYLPLKKHQAVEFNVFTMPVDEQEMGKTADSNLWKITINTAQHGSFSYTLVPTSDGTVYELEPGKIHKVKVPQLAVNGTVDWDPEKWITQIPVPVYISELSMPGTWYSCHSDYQNTTDLTLQYKAGVRAFNLDCRITYETEGGEDVLVDRGSIWTTEDDVYRAAEKYLVVAGTDGVGTGGSGYDSGDLVVDKLKTIAALIPNDEYVVVVLTIAEKPLTRNPLLGNTIVSGTVDPAQIIPAIKDIIDGNAKDSNGDVVTADMLKLYRNKVTSMTTIDDVKDHMIVKINTNNSGISNYTYPTNSLVSFASMAMSDWNTSGDNITDLASDYYTKMQTADMYWGNAETDLNYYYHQAQRTTSGVNEYDTNGTLTGTDYSTTYQVEGVPTIQMRKDAIKNIISQSKTIYDNGAHNGWFQLGIGGYIKDNDYADPNQSDVATALNSYVQNLIEDKMDTDPSPVGIVLMNHACDASGNGIQLVKDIIEMNGKFYLKRQGGSIITGDGDDTDTTNPTPAPAKNAAYAVVGDDAF